MSGTGFVGQMNTVNWQVVGQDRNRAVHGDIVVLKKIGHGKRSENSEERVFGKVVVLWGGGGIFWNGFVVRLWVCCVVMDELVSLAYREVVTGAREFFVVLL